MQQLEPQKDRIHDNIGGKVTPPRPYQPQNPAKHVLPSSRHLAAVPGKIDVIPFARFPEIARLNFLEYPPGIKQLFSKHTGASPELEEAVNNVMLNLFVNSGQKVVKPGKLDYNHFEKQYNHDQLIEYLRNITCLEVYFCECKTRIGHFTRNERYVIENLLENNFPYKGTTHLAYIDDTPDSPWKRYAANKKERLRDSLVEQCDSELTRIQAEIAELQQQMSPEKYQKEEQEIEALLKGVKTEICGDDDREFAESESCLLNIIKTLQKREGTISRKMADAVNVNLRSQRYQRENSPELEAEFRKNPTYEQILENIASCLAPKGVLILNPAQARTFQGFKNLGNFGKVGVYQKVL